MQQKIGSKSAGRVQSVALKLVVDREKEIEAFNKEEYWDITANFTKNSENSDYVYQIKSKFIGTKDDKITLGSEEETNKVLDAINDKPFKLQLKDLFIVSINN